MTWSMRSSTVPARTSSPSKPTPTSTSGSTLERAGERVELVGREALGAAFRRLQLATAQARRLGDVTQCCAPASSRTARRRAPDVFGRRTSGWARSTRVYRAGPSPT